MIKFLTLLPFFISLSSFSFTLQQGRTHFPTNDVVIDISSNNCVNAGYTSSEIFGLVQNAINDYWNQVSTCALELRMGEITEDDVSNLTFSEAVNLTKSNHILVGCNSEASVIPSTEDRKSVIAQATIQKVGDSTRGVVLINDFSDTPFDNLTDRQRLAMLAHEIGHAFGLGHSELPVSLMYFSAGTKVQEHLSIDDYDGCTYLYPKKGPVSCSTVALLPKGGSNGDAGWKKKNIWQFFFIGLIGFLLFMNLTRLKSIKRKT